jgi:hypothetical protein
MEALRSQAENAGGQMLSHLGNHEWMNAIGQCARWLLPYSIPSLIIRTFRRLEV